MARETDPAKISPTAHYTGYVWWRNHLSHPSFATGRGRLFYHALRPMNALSRRLGGPTLEHMLLARHRVIDHLLSEAIERGEIGQVVEVAAGLSPRGHRFVRRFPQLIYREADLPDMVRQKRELLSSAGFDSSRHSVVEVDALADTGDRTIAAVTADLDPDVGLAFITEGLVNYFAPESAAAMWRRFAEVLARHPTGLYLSDIHCDDGIARGRTSRVFRDVLSLATRRQLVEYFADGDAVCQALGTVGFGPVDVHYAGDFGQLGVPSRSATAYVRVIEARPGGNR